MLLHKIQTFVREQQLLASGDRVLAAVSGGPDSMAMLELLRLFREQGWLELFAVHIHHGLREKEADGDAALVADYCRKHRIPLRVESIDARALSHQWNMNLQEAARQARYRLFKEAAAAVKAKKVALAHHRDDQAETVLMRLLRGTGLSGLSGIPIRRPLDDTTEIVRPLLETSKREIERFCREHEVPYRLDTSNRSKKYFRNRLRLEVIPYLESFNPLLKDHLSKLAKMAKAENEYFMRAVDATLKKMTLERAPGKVAVKRGELLETDEALRNRIIMRLISMLSDDEIDMAYAHVQDTADLIRSNRASGHLDLPGGIKVRISYDRVSLYRSQGAETGEAEESPSVRLQVPGETFLPWTERSIVAEILPPSSRPAPSLEVACFDRQQLHRPLWARKRREGDRIRPLGMKGSKKVKDIFIDKKVPREDRETIPLITCGDEVIWIPSLARSDKALVTDATEEIVCLHVKEKGNIP